MAKKNTPPLIIEQIQDATNMLYLSLVEYKKKDYLVIIDNIKGNEITAFVLDQAEAESVDMTWFLSVSTRWYYQSSERYPLSFEFNKLGRSDAVAPILKTFKMDYISRLMGKLFFYDMDRKPKVRRKKVQAIPSGIEIKLRRK